MLCSLRLKQRPKQLLRPFKAQLAVSTAGTQQIFTVQQETVTPPGDDLSAKPGLCRGKNTPQLQGAPWHETQPSATGMPAKACHDSPCYWRG